MPANALEKVSLQLKWFHQFQFAGYYAALEKGYYREVGLDVSLLERAKKETPLSMVLSEQAEYGISDSSLILNRLNGSPVVVLGAIFQHSPLILMTRKEDQLFSPYELKGKKVMRQYNVDDASLTAMFHTLGVNKNNIIDVPHSFNDNDFFSGKVDAISAYISDQPYLAKQKGIDIHIIDPINYGVDFYGDMLFVSEEEMRENPKRALNFLSASIKGWQYALNNKEEIIHLIKEQYSTKKSIEHLRFEASAIERMIAPNLIEIGHLNKARFERLAAIYQAEDMASKNTELQGIDYREYIEKPITASIWDTWFIFSATAILILLIILININRRLKKLVDQRTEALYFSNKKLEKYSHITEKNVFTSTVNTKGIITDISNTLFEASEYLREELIGRHYSFIQQIDDNNCKNKKISQCISSGISWHGEIEGKTKKNTRFLVKMNIEPEINNTEIIASRLSALNDITDIERLAFTDELTGLYNRAKLDGALALELYRVNRTHENLSVILIDIDYFKTTNDTYGHLFSDKTLIHVSRIIKKSVRSFDIIGRWGEKEFFIISPSTNLDDAYALATIIRNNIQDSPLDNINITASLGVACFNLGEQSEGLVKRADDALYAAKYKGRNRVESNQDNNVYYLSER
jgi:diguanylate cyclase (GGDEF)-like protein/PAS domain S-box-containing protein